MGHDTGSTPGANTVCVILAGGRGKRMASRECHKVCFPIAGVPAIVRALNTYQAAGLHEFLVVVGQMAEQVMGVVTGACPGAAFAFQTEPHGTGHAAATAAAVLAQRGFQGDVLIVMGDKVTRTNVVKRLLDTFCRSGADLVLTALPKTAETTAGRVVQAEDGGVVGVVELADIRRARECGCRIRVGGVCLSADEVEARSPTVNASLYMFRFPPLLDALRSLRPNNAQGELYLTDCVAQLARHGRVEVLPVSDPRDLMAFNTPAELLAIEDVVRERERARRPRIAARAHPPPCPDLLHPASEWAAALEDRTSPLCRSFPGFYGADPALIAERRNSFRALAAAAAETLGPDRPVLLCRAPGRINLMGRHVDHRGGYVNVMAISREILVAAAPRDDDAVTLRNLDENRFPPRKFCIRELLDESTWTDWMDFLESETVRRVLTEAPGDWSHYARAPLLRLQHAFQDIKLRGMDCIVSGNVPMGAGLSSSSALVVAFAECAVALNGVGVTPRDFVDLCGEGEWFVGSRGGSGDHAAIRTGKPGAVSRIGFFPFRIEGEVAFPDDLEVVVAFSGATAEKSAGARDIFNQRVACYRIGERLLRRRWPPAAGIRHLRDLTPERLRLPAADIYRALAMLPVRPSRLEIRKLLVQSREDAEFLDRTFASHEPAAARAGYDLRGVLQFGISECVRSARFAQLLEAGDIPAIGRLMIASHNGDRRWVTAPDGALRRFRVRMDDRSLLRLAAQNADLSLRPGRYACSTRAIDGMVDLAATVPGVVGAQIAGAGLGGCMMILVHADARGPLLDLLRREFYTPRELPPAAYVCRPVAGASLLRF
ncbi:MAG: NTP transferase domain-containing protein [Kiritimatiellaeota bacterium]|nr:NTP transferase domain-containing protein [Kiritimatiellota bacterium]